MINFLIDTLKKYHIKHYKIGRTIKFSKETTIPITIQNEKIFIKITQLEKNVAIKKEIEVVKFLEQSGVQVQKYYDFNRNIPYNEKYCLYATYNAGDFYNLEQIDKNFIIKCITNIAKMHRKLKLVSVKNSPFKLESDYERLNKFYQQNKQFFIDYKLDKCVKKMKKTKYEVSDLIFIHSDLNFNNITTNGTIIDFSDLKIGLKEDDLGKFYQNILNTRYNTLSDLGFFLQYYQKELGEEVKKEELILSIIYRLIFRFFNSLKEDANCNIELIYKALIENIKKIKEWGKVI